MQKETNATLQSVRQNARAKLKARQPWRLGHYIFFLSFYLSPERERERGGNITSLGSYCYSDVKKPSITLLFVSVVCHKKEVHFVLIIFILIQQKNAYCIRDEIICNLASYILIVVEFDINLYKYFIRIFKFHD
jgi:hypothetical protein